MTEPKSSSTNTHQPTMMHGREISKNSKNAPEVSSSTALHNGGSNVVDAKKATTLSNNKVSSAAPWKEQAISSSFVSLPRAVSLEDENDDEGDVNRTTETHHTSFENSESGVNSKKDGDPITAATTSPPRPRMLLSKQEMHHTHNDEGYPHGGSTSHHHRSSAQSPRLRKSKRQTDDDINVTREATLKMQQLDNASSITTTTTTEGENDDSAMMMMQSLLGLTSNASEMSEAAASESGQKAGHGGKENEHPVQRTQKRSTNQESVGTRSIASRNMNIDVGQSNHAAPHHPPMPQVDAAVPEMDDAEEQEEARTTTVAVVSPDPQPTQHMRQELSKKPSYPKQGTTATIDQLDGTTSASDTIFEVNVTPTRPSLPVMSKPSQLYSHDGETPLTSNVSSSSYYDNGDECQQVLDTNDASITMKKGGSLSHNDRSGTNDKDTKSMKPTSFGRSMRKKRLALKTTKKPKSNTTESNLIIAAPSSTTASTTFNLRTVLPNSTRVTASQSDTDLEATNTGAPIPPHPLTLHRAIVKHAPIEVIRCLLKLNPQAVNVPVKLFPQDGANAAKTALQRAIECRSPLEVLREIAHVATQLGGGGSSLPSMMQVDGKKLSSQTLPPAPPPSQWDASIREAIKLEGAPGTMNAGIDKVKNTDSTAVPFVFCPGTTRSKAPKEQKKTKRQVSRACAQGKMGDTQRRLSFEKEVVLPQSAEAIHVLPPKFLNGGESQTERDHPTKINNDDGSCSTASNYYTCSSASEEESSNSSSTTVSSLTSSLSSSSSIKSSSSSVSSWTFPHIRRNDAFQSTSGDEGSMSSTKENDGGIALKEGSTLKVALEVPASNTVRPKMTLSHKNELLSPNRNENTVPSGTGATANPRQESLRHHHRSDRKGVPEQDRGDPQSSPPITPWTAEGTLAAATMEKEMENLKKLAFAIYRTQKRNVTDYTKVHDSVLTELQTQQRASHAELQGRLRRSLKKLEVESAQTLHKTLMHQVYAMRHWLSEECCVPLQTHVDTLEHSLRHSLTQVDGHLVQLSKEASHSHVDSKYVIDMLNRRVSDLEDQLDSIMKWQVDTVRRLGGVTLPSPFYGGNAVVSPSLSKGENNLELTWSDEWALSHFDSQTKKESNDAKRGEYHTPKAAGKEMSVAVKAAVTNDGSSQQPFGSSEKDDDRWMNAAWWIAAAPDTTEDDQEHRAHGRDTNDIVWIPWEHAFAEASPPMISSSSLLTSGGDHTTLLLSGHPNNHDVEGDDAVAQKSKKRSFYLPGSLLEHHDQLMRFVAERRSHHHAKAQKPMPPAEHDQEPSPLSFQRGGFGYIVETPPSANAMSPSTSREEDSSPSPFSFAFITSKPPRTAGPAMASSTSSSLTQSLFSERDGESVDQLMNHHDETTNVSGRGRWHSRMGGVPTTMLPHPTVTEARTSTENHSGHGDPAAIPFSIQQQQSCSVRPPKPVRHLIVWVSDGIETCVKCIRLYRDGFRKV